MRNTLLAHLAFTGAMATFPLWYGSEYLGGQKNKRRLMVVLPLFTTVVVYLAVALLGARDSNWFILKPKETDSNSGKKNSNYWPALVTSLLAALLITLTGYAASPLIYFLKSRKDKATKKKQLKLDHKLSMEEEKAAHELEMLKNKNLAKRTKRVSKMKMNMGADEMKEFDLHRNKGRRVQNHGVGIRNGRLANSEDGHEEESMQEEYRHAEGDFAVIFCVAIAAGFLFRRTRRSNVRGRIPLVPLAADSFEMAR